jgi:hypothetical protein
MRRLLFIIVATLWLSLGAIVCTEWVRSYGYVENGSWAGERYELSYNSWSGCFGGWATIGDGPSRSDERGLQYWRWEDEEHIYSEASPPVKPGPSRWGFGLSIDRTIAGGWLRGGYLIVSVFAPYWFITGLISLPPGLFLGRRLKRGRRRRRGLCQSCGYDLRATNNRCPECGIAKPAVDAPVASGV